MLSNIVLHVYYHKHEPKFGIQFNPALLVQLKVREVRKDILYTTSLVQYIV